MKNLHRTSSVFSAVCGAIITAMLIAPIRSAEVDILTDPLGFIKLGWPQDVNTYSAQFSTNLANPDGWVDTGSVPIYEQTDSIPPVYNVSVQITSSNNPPVGNVYFRLRELLPPTGSAPVITSPPRSLVVHEGVTNATISLMSPSAGVKYQWLKDNGMNIFFPLDGETSPTLRLPSTGEFEDGARFCCLMQSAITTFSQIVTLHVIRHAAGTLNGWGSRTAYLPSSFVDIVAGGGFGLGLKTNGTISAWGDNTFGQTNAPPIPGVIRFAAGQYHGVAALTNFIFCWGRNDRGQAPPTVPVAGAVQVAAGYSNSVALANDGQIRTWGDNSHGQSNIPAGLSNVVAIAAGGDNVAYLQADGTLKIAGDNSAGQTNVPAGLAPVKAVTVGGKFVAALLYNGSVTVWGDNTYGQTNVPPGLSNVVAIAAMDKDVVALKWDNTVVIWGDNSAGQTNPPIITDVMAIAGATGGDHGLALSYPSVLGSDRANHSDAYSAVHR